MWSGFPASTDARAGPAFFQAEAGPRWEGETLSLSSLGSHLLEVSPFPASSAHPPFTVLLASSLETGDSHLG